MRISTKGIYGLEAVVDLALNADAENLASLKQVAARRNISEKYLERIVGMLKKAGVVTSVRGAYGGYCLAKAADELTVFEVLSAVEGDMAPVQCLTEESDCGIDCERCATRGTWYQLWMIMKDSMETITIGEIKKLVLDK